MTVGTTDLPSKQLTRYRLSGTLLAVGMAIEASTLFSSTPTGFLAFALCGASLVVAGLAVYLYALFSS